MAGVLNEVRQSGVHATIYLVTECGGHSLKEALVDRKLYVYIKEEEWDVVSRNVVLKRERT